MKGLFDTILLAADGSPDAERAARVAMDVADRCGARLHVVHVWTKLPPTAYPPLTLYNSSHLYEQDAGELLEDQVSRIRDLGGEVAFAHLREGRPADEVAGLAGEIGADLVVVGSRGLGRARRIVAGSVAEGVVRLAPCPVLVVRGEDGAWPPREVIAGDDASDAALRAGELAAGLADALGVPVRLVRGFPPLPITNRAGYSGRRRADEILARGRRSLEERATQIEASFGLRPDVEILVGDAAAAIQEAAERDERPALVAVGSRGLGAVGRLALGSVSTDVLRGVDGPVLVSPLPGESRDG